MPGVNKHGVVLTNEASLISPARVGDSVQGHAWDGTQHFVSYSGGSNRISTWNTGGTETATNATAATLLNSVTISSLGDICIHDGDLWVASGVEDVSAFVFQIDPATLTYISHVDISAGVTGAKKVLNGVARYGTTWYVGTAGLEEEQYTIDQFDDAWGHIQLAYQTPGKHEFGIQSLAVWGRYLVGGGHAGSMRVWYIKDDGTLDLVQENQDTSWAHASTANMQGVDVVGDQLWILDRVGTGTNTGQIYRYDIAEKSSGVWLPTRLSPQVWLDASDASQVITSGAAVTAWRDKGWYTVDVAQGTAGSRPTKVAAAINGLDIIRFDNTDDFMTRSVAGRIVMRRATGMSIFAVFAATAAAPASNRGLFIVVTGGGATFRASLYIEATTKKIAFGGRRLDADAFAGVASASAVDTSPHVFVGVGAYSTTTAKLYQDGTEVGSSTSWLSSGLSEDTGGETRVVSSALPLGSDVGEIVFFDYPLGTSDRQLMEGYLAWKWGLQANLPVGHPYEDAAPTLDIEAATRNAAPMSFIRQLRKRRAR